MTQNRFKSWALWVSVAGAVWVVLSAFGLTEKIGITNETWNAILNATGTILIALGIVNNPTDKQNW
jgi:phi LC3 family holin